MNQDVIESRILQLIYLAECDIECCKIIFQKKAKFAPAIENYLTLVGNNHFFEAVNMMSTILYPTNGEREISFPLWGKAAVKKIPPAIDEVKNNFKSQGFLQLRHNITAHTNAKESGDPEIKAVIPIVNGFVDDLSTIVSKLRDECSKIFKDVASNNYLLRGTKSGLEDILVTLQSIRKSEHKKY